MSAAAVAFAPPPVVAPPSLGGNRSTMRRTSVVSLLPYKDRALELFASFESTMLNSTDRTDIIRRRIGMAQRHSALLGEYSRDTRSMILEGLTLDFDLPLHCYDCMSQLMARVAKDSSEKMSSKLSQAAKRTDGAISNPKTPAAERISLAMSVLQEIHQVHQELKRFIAEFGSFFQPLATIPAGFFNLPPINIQQKFLSNVAQFWASTADGVKKCIFAATDAERSVYHQRDAGTNPEALRIRKAVADALTFWMRIQDKGEELLKTKFIPDYLKDCEEALSRVGSKMSVKELLDVTVIRIENEQDRFQQLFNQDSTPVRRVVQLGLVKSQVERISHDHEVGLNAALAALPYAEIFHKLVMMLDFEQKCIDSIGDAITRNVASELGSFLAAKSSGQEADESGGKNNKNTNNNNNDDEEEDNENTARNESVIDIVASVYEKYRAAVATCQTTDQNKLRFYVAIRLGVNSGMGHAGMETTLVHHFHKLLKDSGALSPAEIQFLAFDVRAAVATFAPLLRDVDVFVRVYQHRLGSRLMSRKAPNPKLESFTVEELTGSIGIAYTHGMRAMIDQFTSSINAINNKKKIQAKTTSPSALQPSVVEGGNYIPVSKYAWPSFSMMSQNTLTLHPMIQQMTKNDLEAFNKANLNKEISGLVHPLLTSVELRTGNGAGIFGNAVQCSMLMFLAEAKQQGKSGMTTSELAQKMTINDVEAFWIAETLVRSKVATTHVETGNTYAMVSLESNKRIVLSSVWGSASSSAARGAKAGRSYKRLVIGGGAAASSTKVLDKNETASRVLVVATETPKKDNNNNSSTSAKGGPGTFSTGTADDENEDEDADCFLQ